MGLVAADFNSVREWFMQITKIHHVQLAMPCGREAEALQFMRRFLEYLKPESREIWENEEPAGLSAALNQRARHTQRFWQGCSRAQSSAQSSGVFLQNR